MPTTSMPNPGFQAIILCGPGVSFDTFTSKPEESPKALIPIANRPMVWYPLDFCYRMGVTHITLITPPTSAPAITTALHTNPHLTSLPSPRPILLAPKDLDQTTGTAQIFRLPEVRFVITGDFIVLPCDLVCELGGESFLETWMVKEASLGGAAGTFDASKGPQMAISAEKGGRRGGFGVWYSTKGELTIKDEETDFIAISHLAPGPVPPPKGSLLPNVSKLIYSLPTDTLNDIVEKKKALPVRHSLLRKYPHIKMLTNNRDSHFYIFPAWVLEMINRNEHMESLSEDVIGWWTKAGWQEGLGENLGLQEIFDGKKVCGSDDGAGWDTFLDEDIDIGKLTTTQIQNSLYMESLDSSRIKLASQSQPGTKAELHIPPILAYIHPARDKARLIRRVDTAPLLLLISLHLAKLESIEQVGRKAASPFAHVAKISYPTSIAVRCTVTKGDCLLAENVTVEEKCAIKECVIGANCHIQSGAKLTRCLLMDGVVVGRGCKLTGSILGRRAEIGDDSILQDCEVEDCMRVEPKTEAKKEKFKSAEGLEATEADIESAFKDEDTAGLAIKGGI